MSCWFAADRVPSAGDSDLHDGDVRSISVYRLDEERHVGCQIPLDPDSLGTTASGKATTAPCSSAQGSIRLRRSCWSAVDRVPCRLSTTALGGLSGASRREVRLAPPTEMLWPVVGTPPFYLAFIPAGRRRAERPPAGGVVQLH
jgi:hypothetical protein